MANNERVIPVDIEDEMKTAYLDYAMSVIVGRALPDVRDGFKPVHRRILFAMGELGFTADKPHKKSARVVGEVIGKYHPHGEAAIYDATVRMAQHFSMRYPLVDGHGNFGSVDGDPAAAMRYTEVRLTPLAMDLLADIDKDTVDFRGNFDESLQEPVFLPSPLPNLLLNGSSGIAVGMATNIPPHNLNEVVDALVLLIDDQNTDIDDIMEVIQGPDFPTGGKIMGRESIMRAYKTGRGTVTIRGIAEIEETKGGKKCIIIRELPYQVNKASLIEKIAELVKDNKIDGISDLRDESDRDGMRMVIELKRRSRPKVILSRLYKNTRLQANFGVNMLALVDNEPKVLNIKDILCEYLKHQQLVITRRTKFLLAKAEERAHILEGLRIALDYLDEVIALIRQSPDGPTAKSNLMERFKLSDKQAQAILDMRLQRLTGLEREKIEEEYKEVSQRIAYYKHILADESHINAVIKEEILKLKEKYGDERRTKIVAQDAEIDIEDLIPNEEMLVSLSYNDYINRMPLRSYQSQRRGGLGTRGMSTKEEDFVSGIFTAFSHDYLLFFTSRGFLYRMKVYEIPENHRQGKGIALVNLLPLQEDETIKAVIPVREFKEDSFLLMVTKGGLVKKTALKEYRSRYTSLRAINLREGDNLISVRHIDDESQVVLGTRKGKSIRFTTKEINPLGRAAQGVKGINLDKDDEVIGMAVVEKGYDVLTISEKGYGKRTVIDEYRVQARGGKGVFACNITKESGDLAGFTMVKAQDDVMVITREGRLIRIKIKEVPRFGRNTRGVRIMRLGKGDRIVSMARVKE